MQSHLQENKHSSKILLVIPFYNEANRISVMEFNDIFKTYPHIDFLLADDGSTDATSKLLHEIKADIANVNTLILSENSGKANAIRQAVLHSGSNYDYVGYIDADLATPVSEFDHMVDFANENPKYHFIMGCRVKKVGSNIVRYSYRHYIGRVFATIISKIILRTPFYDTQCGAKIIKSGLALELFDKPFLTRWFFDVELLLRYRNKKIDFDQHVYEYSLNTWIEKGDSKITFGDMLRFPFQLVQIYFRYKCYR